MNKASSQKQVKHIHESTTAKFPKCQECDNESCDWAGRFHSGMITFHIKVPMQPLHAKEHSTTVLLP